MDDTRERWIHEDQLINHRLGWLGVTQGILLAAYGMALRELSTLALQTPRSPLYDPTHFLAQLPPPIGFSTSLLVFVGVLAANIVMYRIGDISRSLNYGISRRITLMGQCAGVGIPLIFVVVWLLLGARGLASL